MMRVRVFVKFLILLLLFLGCSRADYSELEIGGVIRPDDKGVWYLLNDQGHKPLGLANITQSPTCIQVNFTKHFRQIGWAAVTPDEMLVMNDLNCGARVGFEKVQIFLAWNGKPINPNRIRNSCANIWIYIKGY